MPPTGKKCKRQVTKEPVETDIMNNIHSDLESEQLQVTGTKVKRSKHKQRVLVDTESSSNEDNGDEIQLRILKQLE